MDVSFGDAVTTGDWREYAILVVKETTFLGLLMDGSKTVKEHLLSDIVQIEPGGGINEITSKFGILAAYSRIFRGE